MSKRIYWIACAALALAACIACWSLLFWPHTPGPGVTLANVARIRAGMTEPEVEAVVGRPPQTRLRGPDPITDHSPPGYREALLWSDAECDILVYLDGSGRVIDREAVVGEPAPWYHRLRRFFGG